MKGKDQLFIEISVVAVLCVVMLMAFPRYRTPQEASTAKTEFVFSCYEAGQELTVHYPGYFAYASPYGFGVLGSLYAPDIEQVATLQEPLSYTPILEEYQNEEKQE